MWKYCWLGLFLSGCCCIGPPLDSGTSESTSEPILKEEKPTVTSAVPILVDVAALAYKSSDQLDKILGKPINVTETGRFRDYARSGVDVIIIEMANDKAIGIQIYFLNPMPTARETLRQANMEPSPYQHPSVTMMAESWTGMIHGLPCKRVRASCVRDEGQFDEVFVELEPRR